MLSRIPKSTRIWIAFASVYVLWGSTYSAIHVAGEQLPTPVVAATRSLLTATIIAAICRLRRKSLRVPPGEGWKLALVGLLFMSGNNMLLVLGEKMVPSGFASLIVSTMPIMIALLEMLLHRLGHGGEPLIARGWAGTLLGMAGIAVLVSPSLHGQTPAGASRPVLGVLVLLGAAFSFAVGSVLSRRFHFQADTLVATGWQIGTAGIFNTLVALLGAGLLGGPAAHLHWTWHGFAAIVYLSVFGSLFGLVAFTYLLQNVAVTKVSTYAFVNPAIAVLLGVVLLHERVARSEVLGMAVIVCGVAMVIYSRVQRLPPGRAAAR
jgi:drug/metabolite transporter (DMT)-like permease